MSRILYLSYTGNYLSRTSANVEPCICFGNTWWWIIYADFLISQELTVHGRVCFHLSVCRILRNYPTNISCASKAALKNLTVTVMFLQQHAEGENRGWIPWEPGEVYSLHSEGLSLLWMWASAADGPHSLQSQHRMYRHLTSCFVMFQLNFYKTAPNNKRIHNHKVVARKCRQTMNIYWDMSIDIYLCNPIYGIFDGYLIYGIYTMFCFLFSVALLSMIVAQWH